MEKSNCPSFVDLAQQGRKSNTRDFLRNVDQIIDWRPIQNIIHKHYTKGHSASGQTSVAGLVLFKMLLLQTWHGLSDYQVEDRVNDSLAFTEFIGTPLDFASPDHSLVSKFRTELTKTKAFEKLFIEVTKQLMKKGIIVKVGAIVDATLTRSPRSPKGKTTYEITNDREDPKDPEQEKEQLKLVKVKQPGR